MADQQQESLVIADTLTLLIASEDPASFDALEALAGAATPRIALTRCTGLDAALAQDARSPVIVPVWMPLDHLRCALQAGEAPDAALDGWCDAAAALLARCRKARLRVVMVDAGVLETRPATSAGPLGDRLGVTFAAAPDGSLPLARAATQLAPVQSVIAASLLAQDARALELADELEAMIVGPVTPQIPDRAEIAAAAQRATALTEERDMLRESLQQTHAETDRLTAEQAVLENTLAKLTKDRDRADALLSETQNTLTAADTARAQLETNLKKERAAAAEAARTAAQQATALTEERDMLRESLQQMLAETDRLTAEQAVLEAKIESLNGQLAEMHLLRAQTEALSRQLDAALESGVRRAAVLGAQILRQATQAGAHHAQTRDRLEAELQVVRATCAQIDTDLTAAREEIARLATELQAARDETARVYASRSWKITGPLRAASHGLRKP